jgi:hypothetical protein
VGNARKAGATRQGIKGRKEGSYGEGGEERKVKAMGSKQRL